MSIRSQSDITLIGAGIMSGTLGALLKELDGGKTIRVFEKLSAVGLESSNEWNNAGTGHAALCELNYTEQQADGSVAIERAIGVNEKFQTSLQFWSYLVEQGRIADPQQFIRPIPHISFVQGEADIQFLKKRFEALSNCHLFDGMVFSQDQDQLRQWIPLMMEDRKPAEQLAATYIADGTDVNFGALTRKLFTYLADNGAEISVNHSVTDFQKTAEGWELTVTDLTTNQTIKHHTKFVFIGCGGASLHLLQKTDIPESKHIGGFPVSGLFMVCKNPDVIAKHHAKVYGKAKVGAPPMSVPHLDTRVINGEKTLLFGPFAGFTSKFLKEGSVFDLLTSIKPNNFTTVSLAGIKNLPLAHYLVKQVMLTKEERMAELREFLPTAKDEDWELLIAGQRVQIVKDTPQEKGLLCFGTEVISSQDGSIAALLGASPGASVSVDVMLSVLQKCFLNQRPEWATKLAEIIPSFGKSLRNEPALFAQIKQQSQRSLMLK